MGFIYIHSIMEITMQVPFLLLPLSVFDCCRLAALHPLLRLPRFRLSLLDAALGGCWLFRGGTELCRLLGGTKLGRLLGLSCWPGGLHGLHGCHSYNATLFRHSGKLGSLSCCVLDELETDGARYL